VDEINAALVQHATGYRDMARRFNVSPDALWRHERQHLRAVIQQSRELRMTLSADNLLDKLSELDAATREMLEEARSAGNLRVALAAVRESRENISAYARIGVVTELEQRVAALEAPVDRDDGDSGDDSGDDCGDDDGDPEHD
jgi:hypothetical protein